MIDRRGWMGRMVAALAAVPLASLAACGYRSETFRYRLMVEVDTPSGVKTGSSVIEVTLSESGDSGFVLPDASGVELQVRGEAVAVDLPGGRTLFALLRTEEQSDAAGLYAHRAIRAPRFDGEYASIEKIRYMKAHPGSGTLTQEHRPLLVTFGDVADPASVARVDPDNLAASFGEGYALKRISVMLTDDPVTEGIEERLGWLDGYRKQFFDGTSTISEDMTTDDLRAHLTAGSFSTEFAR